MVIVTHKVHQEDLERFQRLCENLGIAKKEPSGPSWDAKERVERNVHPYLLSIIDELLEHRAAAVSLTEREAGEVDRSKDELLASMGDTNRVLAMRLSLAADRLPEIARILQLGVEEADKDEPNDGYETLYNATEKALRDIRVLRRDLNGGAASPTRKGSSEWVPVGEWKKEHHKAVEVLYTVHKGWASTTAYWDGMGEFWRRESSGNKLKSEVLYVTPTPTLPALPPFPQP